MESTIKTPKAPSISKVAARPRRQTTTAAAVRQPALHLVPPREPYVEQSDRSTLLAFYFYISMLGIALIYFLILPFFM